MAMAARAVVFVTFAVVASAASCATSQEVPTGIDYGDNVTSSRDAGASGESGGSSGSADGGSSAMQSAGGAPASTGSGGGETVSGGASARGSGGKTESEDSGPPLGGAPSASGGKGALDAGAGPACKQGEKMCRSDGMCWPIAPQKGCDMDDRCTPCPAPPTNGFSTCVNQACNFDCLSGFRKNTQGTGCERGSATGGATGAGGTTGSGGRNRGGRGGTGAGGSGTGGSGTGGSSTCSRSNCPDCGNILEAPCCRDDGTCGCGLLGIGALCN